MAAPRVILIAGVSGSGKSTIGTMLADRLGWDYAEGDEFHSRANIEKMRSGRPLTDADRLPWLRDIRAWIEDRVSTGRPGVVSSSGLKREYRRLLAGGRDEVAVVMLDGDRNLIETRMKGRLGHFFSHELLDTQFADLEPPTSDEDVVIAPISGNPEETVAHILKALDLPQPQKRREETDGPRPLQT